MPDYNDLILLEDELCTSIISINRMILYNFRIHEGNTYLKKIEANIIFIIIKKYSRKYFLFKFKLVTTI